MNPSYHETLETHQRYSSPGGPQHIKQTRRPVEVPSWTVELGRGI